MNAKGKPVEINIPGLWYPLQVWPAFTLYGNAPTWQQSNKFIELPPEFCHPIDTDTLVIVHDGDTLESN